MANIILILDDDSIDAIIVEGKLILFYFFFWTRNRDGFFFTVDRFFTVIVSMPSKIPHQYYNITVSLSLLPRRTNLSHSEFRRNARAQRGEYRSGGYYRTSRREFYRVYPKREPATGLKHLVLRATSRNADEDGSGNWRERMGDECFSFTLERDPLFRLLRSQLGPEFFWLKTGKPVACFESAEALTYASSHIRTVVVFFASFNFIENEFFNKCIFFQIRINL